MQKERRTLAGVSIRSAPAKWYFADASQIDLTPANHPFWEQWM